MKIKYENLNYFLNPSYLYWKKKNKCKKIMLLWTIERFKKNCIAFLCTELVQLVSTVSLKTVLKTESLLVIWYVPNRMDNE